MGSSQFHNIKAMRNPISMRLAALFCVGLVLLVVIGNYARRLLPPPPSPTQFSFESLGRPWIDSYSLEQAKAAPPFTARVWQKKRTEDSLIVYMRRTNNVDFAISEPLTNIDQIAFLESLQVGQNYRFPGGTNESGR